MNYRRTLGAVKFCLFVSCLLTVSSYEAAAQVYPPTKDGLRQLVAADIAFLPRPYALKLQKKEADWEQDIGVKCYKRWVGPAFSQTHCVSDGAGGIKCSKQTIHNLVPASCFPTAKNVIADIQAHIFKVDGFVIDSNEWSGNIPSPEIPAPGGGLMPSGLPVALSQIFPKVVSTESPAAEAFNRAAMDFGLNIWTHMGGPTRSNPESDNNEDFEIDYAQNKDPLPGVISISYSWGDAPHDAAHGQFGGYDFNWNIAQKRPVEVDDIFDTTTDWKHGLATAILAAFQSSNQSYFANSTADDIIDEVSDPARWAITTAGLRVDTDAYEVGPYAVGAPSAVASWSALKPYLKHGGGWLLPDTRI